MNKLGINYDGCFDVPMQESLAFFAELGFESVFSDDSLDRKQMAVFAKTARDNGLFYECVHSPFDGINEMWKPGEAGEQMLKRLCDYVEWCSEFAVPITVVHLSSGQNPPYVNDIGYARYSKLVESAVKHNVTLAFENIRKLANVAFVFEVFGNVENVKFCWDTGHESCYTQGIEFMPLFGDKLAFTHIHDNDGIYDHDLHMIPFDGVIDFTRCAEHLRKHNYTGTLTLEVLPGASDRYAQISFEDYYRKAYAAAVKIRHMMY